ncbi:MAG: TrmH family RNA methyltransferase [bacterium]|nr:TrmH family RNA methyltransferase [bacterium]
MLKLTAKELRRRKPTKEEFEAVSRNPIYLVLDNVLDTYNIGGLFRLADAIGAREVILCGETETPPSSRIHKAAVGTEEWVAWSYAPTAARALQELKTKIVNLKIIAIEQAPNSVPFSSLSRSDKLCLSLTPNTPVAIVVGHETDGVSKNVLKMADLVVEIPMFGVNKSLNVIVSAAIAAYKILETSS